MPHANSHTFDSLLQRVLLKSVALSYDPRPFFLFATRKIVELASIKPPASSSVPAASSSGRKHAHISKT